MSPRPPEIRMTIPGPWPDPERFAEELAGKGGYIFQGDRIVHVATRRMTPIDVSLHEDSLAAAFEWAGRGLISRANLASIKKHVCSIAIRGIGGSLAAAEVMMHIATAVIRAGGMAVMVDASGFAHGRDEWLRLAALDAGGDCDGLYRAMVRTASSEPETFTCGMHQLGLRDAITSIDSNAAVRSTLLNQFNRSALRAQAILADGDALGDPPALFRVRQEPCTMFPPGSLRHNPYGMWRLRRADETEADETK